MGGLCSHSPLRVSFSRAALLARRILAQGFTCGQFDVIVSNCVVNLSPDKDAVLKGVHGLLKPGGEFYFSDVYADRRVPAAVRNDPVLYGECLGGALYWNDFLRLAMRQGFADPRLVEDRPLEITNPDLAQKTGGVGFHSATYRLFKLDGLESACEDYGQAVIYRGTVPGQPERLLLDKHHAIERGRVFPVCAIPGACCTIPASPRMSISSAISTVTSACSKDAAKICHLIAAIRPPAPAPAAELIKQ